MRRLLLLSLSLALGLADLAAPAWAGSNELTFGGGIRALRSSSANAVTSDSLSDGAIGYARDVHLDLVPALTLWARVGVEWGGVEGTMFQTMTTDVGTVELTAGARARYRLHRRIAASVRLDLGMAHTSLALSGDSGAMARDSSWGVIASGALGLDLLAIARRRFSLGVRAELGYVEASAVPLSPVSLAPSDGTLRLPMTATPFGHLDLSGPSFTISLLSQF